MEDREESAAGAALLEGVVLAGWRTGARVQVECQRCLAIPGAPLGTIHVGRAPQD